MHPAAHVKHTAFCSGEGSAETLPLGVGAVVGVMMEGAWGGCGTTSSIETSPQALTGCTATHIDR
jgi:hypothetical protein